MPSRDLSLQDKIHDQDFGEIAQSFYNYLPANKARFVSRPKDAVGIRDEYGWSLLHHAACRNATKVVNLLTKAGENVNVRDNSGCAPLHTAARHGNLATVDLLIRKKAKLNIEDDDRCTPLSDAVSSRHTDTAKRLMQAKTIKLDSIDRNGRTLLHEAAQKGLKDIVNLLITNVAINAQDNKGNTPLHEAVEAGAKRFVRRLETARSLIDKKAIKHLQNKLGHTPLHLAVSASWEEMVDLLTQKGDQVNIRDKKGLTPLH